MGLTLDGMNISCLTGDGAFNVGLVANYLEGIKNLSPYFFFYTFFIYIYI